MAISEVFEKSEDAPGRHRHVPGEPGVWVLLFGDMVVFTILFTVYLHKRAQNRGPVSGWLAWESAHPPNTKC
jgi:heme/copper-type cytochrome/quinol oxidase subunit 3